MFKYHVLIVFIVLITLIIVNAINKIPDELYTKGKVKKLSNNVEYEGKPKHFKHHRFIEEKEPYKSDLSEVDNFLSNGNDEVEIEEDVIEKFKEYLENKDVIDPDIKPINDEMQSEVKSTNRYSSFKNLPHCTKKSKERGPILVVSTIDSHISGISYLTGELLWSHETGTPENPLLSSSMSNLEVTSNGELVRLIPSLEGGIYKFDGDSVEALPFTADSLLQSTFKFNEDTIFTGGKFSEIIGILPDTGDVKYTCDSSGCPQTNSETNSNQILVVRKVSHTVRAIDPKTGGERWNFSVGEHDVNIANTGCDSLFKDVELSSLPSLHFILPKGIVIAVNSESQVLWQQKLPSPIVSAWSLINGNLNSINLFSAVSVPALVMNEESEGYESHQLNQPDAAVYIGIHQKQLYIQLNKNIEETTHSMQNYLTSGGKGISGLGLLKVQWEPYLASAFSRTPAIHQKTQNHPLLIDYKKKEKSRELAVRHNLDYPLDNGYYLFGNTEGVLSNDSGGFGIEFEEEDMAFSSQIYHFCFTFSPVLCWTILGGLLVYCVLHVVVFKYLFRRILNDVERDMNRRITSVVTILMHNIFREHPQVLGVIQRLGLDFPPLPSPPSPPPSTVNQNQINAISEGSQQQENIFNSRYTSDFEPVRCLGRGGFGVVFHVKNRLDQNEYAVKRILLPTKESSSERVKREVRALAKLSHASIVRYYNSWLETPPVGWEREADSWWKQSDAISPSLLSHNEETTEEPPLASECQYPRMVSSDNSSLSAVVHKLGVNVDSVVVGNELNESNSLSNVYSASDSDSELSDSCGSRNSAINHTYDDSFKHPSPYIFNLAESDDDDSVVFQNHSVTDKETEDLSIMNEKEYNCKILLPSKPPSIGENSQRTKSSSFLLCDKEVNSSDNRRRTKSFDHRPVRPSSLDVPPSALESMKDLSEPGIDEHKIQNNVSSPAAVPRTYLYIQMELCHKESLKEWLFNNPSRDTGFVFSLFNDIVNAVEYVHDRFLMHRDLKPSNIFFSLAGEIKIGDFGLVTSIDDENDALTPMVDSVPSLRKDQSNVQVRQRTLNAGTHLYMSPEQMLGQSYNYKVDIYSLGLILFEMLVPFYTEMERRKVMLQARDKIFPEGFIDKYQDVGDVLHLTLHRKPNERPTTRGLRARPPLASLQRDLDAISSEEHFHLAKPKFGHSRSHSGSYSGFFTSSTSPSGS